MRMYRYGTMNPTIVYNHNVPIKKHENTFKNMLNNINKHSPWLYFYFISLIKFVSYSINIENEVTIISGKYYIYLQLWIPTTLGIQ